MGFTWVQGKSFQTGSATTTVAVTLGSLPIVGNLICVVVQADTYVSLKDENNNSYTITPNSPSNANAGPSGIEWAAYLIAPANAGQVLTWTGSGTLGSAGIFADEFTFEVGFNAVLDVDAAGTGTIGTAVNTPSITPAGAGELLYGGAAVESFITAANSPWTGASTGLGGAIGTYAEYILSSASGATALNFTQSGSGHWDSMAMAFKLVAVFTWVQGKSSLTVVVGATTSATLTSFPTPGNLLCAAGEMFDQTKTLTSIKDENNNSFTVVPASPSSGRASTCGSSFAAYLIAPANVGKVITATFNDGTGLIADLFVDEFNPHGRGIAFDTSIAGDSIASGTSVTISTPTITPAGAGELLYAHASPRNVINTADSPWTGAATGQGSSAGDYVEYILGCSAGGTAVKFTQNSSGDWDSIAMAFRLFVAVASPTTAPITVNSTVSTGIPLTVRSRIRMAY